MKDKPDNCYDLAICDPEYGINRSGQRKTICKKNKHNRKEYKYKKWDLYPPKFAYFYELFRISKNQIIFGGNYFTEYLPRSMGWIFWDKGQDLSMSDGELAFTSFERALRRIIINRSELLKYSPIHPTEKPVKLYRWILQNYAKSNDKILDTHGGSMSIAIACDMEGFNLDICEIDKEYFDNGLKRFNEYKRQLVLF